MTSSKYWTCGVVSMAIAWLLALAAGPATADIPPRLGRDIPAKAPPLPVASETGPAVPFVVHRDETEAVSRIIIPRKLLPAAKALVPAPNSRAAVEPGEEDKESASLVRRSVYTGCMLALVFASGGLAIAFVRRRKAGVGKVLAIGLAVSMLLLGTALADIPSPFGGGRRPRPPRPEPTIPASSAAPTIKVETVDSGDQIILILGRNAPDLPK
jgi:hypothetical protein